MTKTIFVAIAEYLEARGTLMRGGTIIDATLIAASPSTKNKARKRAPDMRSLKKGNQWYFGMKAHIGVDAVSALVHTAGVTTGSVHDAKVMDILIREDDRAVYGDRGYANERKQRLAEAAGVVWAVKAKAKPGRTLSLTQRRRNRRFGKIRAKVQHFPGDDVPVRLSQGSLSRHCQEWRSSSRYSRAPPVLRAEYLGPRAERGRAKASYRGP